MWGRGENNWGVCGWFGGYVKIDLVMRVTDMCWAGAAFFGGPVGDTTITTGSNYSVRNPHLILNCSIINPWAKETSKHQLTY